MVTRLFIPFCYVRILGKRVSELENKLKTLEVAGLWSLPGKCFRKKVTKKANYSSRYMLDYTRLHSD